MAGSCSPHSGSASRGAPPAPPCTGALLNERIGVLLVQLGTPSAPTTRAVRRYLAEFLSDRRVVELPPLLWRPILHGLILRTRPARSAELYRRIWGPDGSPLLLHTRRQSELLAAELRGERPDLEVAFGMRYGEPELGAALNDLLAAGCTRLLVLPLFPHYAGATTGSCIDRVFAQLRGRRWLPALRVAAPFYAHPAYIDAVAARINAAIAAEGAPDRLILSYHGLPRRSVLRGDPYCCMCRETSEMLRDRIALPRARIIQAYQSRFGRAEWLTPYTSDVTKQLAHEGVKHLAVMCPGFVADCLETLSEIGQELRELFLAHGGEKFTCIPCLNDDALWIQGLVRIVTDELGAWPYVARDAAERACPLLDE